MDKKYVKAPVSFLNDHVEVKAVAITLNQTIKFRCTKTIYSIVNFVLLIYLRKTNFSELNNIAAQNS